MEVYIPAHVHGPDQLARAIAEIGKLLTAEVKFLLLELPNFNSLFKHCCELRSLAPENEIKPELFVVLRDAVIETLKSTIGDKFEQKDAVVIRKAVTAISNLLLGVDTNFMVVDWDKLDRIRLTILQQSLKLLREEGSISFEMMKQLFEKDPKMADFFSFGKAKNIMESQSLKKQANTVFGGIARCIDNFEQFDKMTHMLEVFGKDHEGRGVEMQHFTLL